MEITVESKNGDTLIRTNIYELLYHTFQTGRLKITEENFIVKVDGIIQERPENLYNDE
ncbi:MAG: hypothetical protein ABIN18_05670 [Pseudomonadota bacterium]